MKDPPEGAESTFGSGEASKAPTSEAASSPMSEAELVAALRAGDGEAAREFYDRFAPRILRFIRHAMPAGAEADAEDLTQETFMALAEALPYFRGQSSLFTFACAIAHRKVASFVRVAARRTRLGRGAPLQEPGGRSNLDVRRALSALLPENRTVLVLKYVEELSVSEIANIVGVSVRAAESRLARARQALRKLLEASR